MDSESFFFLFSMILLSLTALSFGFYLSSIANDTLFEKIYLGRDISLLMDSVEASPGNIIVQYSNKLLPKFDVNFNPSIVEIYDADSNSGYGYPYGEDGFLNNQLVYSSLKQPEIIQFKINGNNVLVDSGQLTSNLDLNRIYPSKLNINNIDVISVRPDEIYVDDVRTQIPFLLRKYFEERLNKIVKVDGSADLKITLNTNRDYFKILFSYGNDESLNYARLIASKLKDIKFKFVKKDTFTKYPIDLDISISEDLIMEKGLEINKAIVESAEELLK